MSDDSPVMIAVAPNGARKTQRDHPCLPISPGELAATAVACMEAGACMIHLHVRDDNDGHSLDVDRYRQATAAIREAVGDDFIIQVTTEAVGIYNAKQQMQMVRELRPEAVSLAIKELCPLGSDERVAAEFFAWLAAENIAPQYIVYSAEDIRHFNELLARGVIPGEAYSCLLVLGRYTQNQQSDPKHLQAMLQELEKNQPWWLCAFGATESDCMAAAMSEGGNCRVGFENNLLLPNGEVAPNNESMLELTTHRAVTLGRRTASATEARMLLGMR